MGGLFDLTDRVVVVTGGSRGLGRAMVRGYVDAGADVVVASRKLQACEAVAAEERARTGRRVEALACHVGRWDDCDRLAEEAYARFGRVDVLVNNAGMSPLYPSVAEITEDLYDKVLAVNLKGPFRLTAVIGTRMVADGGGVIINVSSMSAIRPSGNEIPYAAAKAGLNNLTAGMAHALGPTVRVNCLMVGPFHTDVSTFWWDEAFEERAKTQFAIGRGGEPEDVIGAAIFFASDASAFCTGATLRFDGGMR